MAHSSLLFLLAIGYAAIPAQAHCPIGWTKSGDACFRGECNEPKNFQDAQEMCTEYGGNLAILQDNNDIYKVVGFNSAISTWWVGYSRDKEYYANPLNSDAIQKSSTQPFHWIGTKFTCPVEVGKERGGIANLKYCRNTTSYTNWALGEPSSTNSLVGEPSCAGIGFRPRSANGVNSVYTNTKTMFALDCTACLPYVCSLSPYATAHIAGKPWQRDNTGLCNTARPSYEKCGGDVDAAGTIVGLLFCCCCMCGICGCIGGGVYFFCLRSTPQPQYPQAQVQMHQQQPQQFGQPQAQPMNGQPQYGVPMSANAPPYTQQALPDGWAEANDPNTGNPYYYKTDGSNHTQHEFPTGAPAQAAPVAQPLPQQMVLPAGWTAVQDAQGKEYYYKGAHTQYEFPTA